jgi:RNA ligase (TIGR02306 family)
MMKRDWGKKLMFFLFGKKKDKKNGWPEWVSKTDEERIENCTFYLKDKEKQWIATEKIDGTSTTFTMKRGKRGKKEMYVCSRNVCFDTIEKPCYYETNVYWEMAQKYDVFNVLSHIIDELGCDWVTIQGETYGEGIQRNTYDLNHHDFRAFNLITSDKGRWNTIDMEKYLTPLGIFSVPILNEGMVLPDTIEELRELVNSEPSVINKKMKEGIVFRTKDGVQSFKCVSPEYLLKFHG